jgi:hypothetical protein
MSNLRLRRVSKIFTIQKMESFIDAGFEF